MQLSAAQHTGGASATPAILTPPPKEAGRRKRRRQEPTTPLPKEEEAPVIDLGAPVLYLRLPSIDVPVASANQCGTYILPVNIQSSSCPGLAGLKPSD
jgi:hypothetical protein